MAKNRYNNYSKEQLLEKIKQLEKVRYGLVWGNKQEEVAEQCDRELPVLHEDTSREIKSKDGLPQNILIEGDNYHALYALTFTHKRKVDVIYIDPPYNTGNKSWKYNNNYVEKEDPFRHSKWLSFISKRLKIAKYLLKDSGVLVLTIDDYEMFPVGMLLNKIFGEKNRLGVVAIESNPRGRTTNKFFATSHEYALFYAKNINLAKIYKLPLTEKQRALFKFKDDISNYRLLPFRRSGGLSTPNERPNSEFSLYYSLSQNNIVAVGGPRKKPYPNDYEPEYLIVLDSKGNFIRSNVKSFLKNNRKDIITIMPIDSSGKRRVWRWSERENILQSAKDDDFKVVNTGKSFTVQLKDRTKEGRKAKTIWVDPKYDASSNGTVLIEKILNKSKTFDYPKSLYATLDCLKVLVSEKKKALILDFFAGSGTTGHAVLELNKDGGKRQFILCTNNEVGEDKEKEFKTKYKIDSEVFKKWKRENRKEWLEWCNAYGICSTVTYPRIKKVIKGYNGNKPIPANLKYFKTDFVPQIITDNDKRVLVSRSTELLCLAENTFELVKKSKKKMEYAIYRNTKQLTAIIYDEDAIEKCKKELEALKPKEKTVIYVFSYDHEYDVEDFEDLTIRFDVKPIPEAILNVYRRNARLKRR